MEAMEVAVVLRFDVVQAADLHLDLFGAQLGRAQGLDHRQVHRADGVEVGLTFDARQHSHGLHDLRGQRAECWRATF